MCVISLQSAYSLKGGTSGKAENLTASENVAVFVCQRQCCTQVTGSVSSLRLHLYGVGLTFGKMHLCIYHCVFCLCKSDVCGAHCLQAGKAVVGILYLFLIVKLAFLEKCVGNESFFAQEVCTVVGYIINMVYWMQMQGVLRISPVKTYVHSDISLMFPARCIDVKGYHLLIEIAVAIIG